MKIGELARLARCTPDTIRFYEKAGLLPAAERTGSNYRTYDAAHLERLRMIRNCRDLDMTHDEVRTLLEAFDAHAPTCSTVNTLIDEHIVHVSTRIDELLKLRDQLTALRTKCRSDQSVDACGIVQALSSETAPRAAPGKTHLG
jgi:Cd(II)/Pb(II)-responsive transcriptional regulator